MGTTAEKLQKALANKQSLVDIVNSKAGTSYTINSKPSDIVETINTQWGEGGGIDGVTLVDGDLNIESSKFNTLGIDSNDVIYNVVDNEIYINPNGKGYIEITNMFESNIADNEANFYTNNLSYFAVNGSGIEYYKDEEFYLNTKHLPFNSGELSLDNVSLLLFADGCTFSIDGNNNTIVTGDLTETDKLYIETDGCKGTIYIDDTPLSEYGGSLPEGLTYEAEEVTVDTDVLRVRGTIIKGSYATVFTEGTTNLTINTTVFNNNISKVFIDGKQLTSDMIAEGVTLFGITGTYKGSSSSATVEGNTLVVSGTVENNTLTLSNGSVEDNTLKL